MIYVRGTCVYMNMQVCVPMCVRAEARAGLGIVFFVALHFTPFIQSLSLSGELLPQLGWPADHFLGSACLHPQRLHPPKVSHTSHHVWLLTWILGAWTQVLMSAEHSFCSLGCLPQPSGRTLTALFLFCVCFWKPALSPACRLWVHTYNRAGIIYLHIKPGDFQISLVFSLVNPPPGLTWQRNGLYFKNLVAAHLPSGALA